MKHITHSSAFGTYNHLYSRSIIFFQPQAGDFNHPALVLKSAWLKVVRRFFSLLRHRCLQTSTNGVSGIREFGKNEKKSNTNNNYHFLWNISFTLVPLALITIITLEASFFSTASKLAVILSKRSEAEESITQHVTLQKGKSTFAQQINSSDPWFKN